MQLSDDTGESQAVVREELLTQRVGLRLRMESPISFAEGGGFALTPGPVGLNRRRSSHVNRIENAMDNLEEVVDAVLAKATVCP